MNRQEADVFKFERDVLVESDFPNEASDRSEMLRNRKGEEGMSGRRMGRRRG